MITYADVHRAACELAEGPHNPSIKVALMAALLSAQTSLVQNGRQMRVLRERGWLRRLPYDHEQVYAAMRGTGMFTRRKCEGLYWVESLDNAGKLRELAWPGDTLEEQSHWREQVYLLLHGHGMAYKTISFACLLLNPLNCQLVPVDRHVLARFGLPGECAKSIKRYLAIEKMVRDERDTAGYSAISLGLWHWLKWEQWREKVNAQVRTGAGKQNGCESHSALSCRAY